VSLAWWQHVRDWNRKNPRMEQLFKEVQQHHITTSAWNDATPKNNTGHIFYLHPRWLSPDSVCQITTTSFDCRRDNQRYYNLDRLRRRWVSHSHSKILIKLRCGCRHVLGLNFYNALKNMEFKTIRMTEHVHECLRLQGQG